MSIWALIEAYSSSSALSRGPGSSSMPRRPRVTSSFMPLALTMMKRSASSPRGNARTAFMSSSGMANLATAWRANRRRSTTSGVWPDCRACQYLKSVVSRVLDDVAGGAAARVVRDADAGGLSDLEPLVEMLQVRGYPTHEIPVAVTFARTGLFHVSCHGAPSAVAARFASRQNLKSIGKQRFSAIYGYLRGDCGAPPRIKVRTPMSLRR